MGIKLKKKLVWLFLLAATPLVGNQRPLVMHGAPLLPPAHLNITTPLPLLQPNLTALSMPPISITEALEAMGIGAAAIIIIGTVITQIAIYYIPFPNAPHFWQNPLHLTCYLNSTWLTKLALWMGADPLKKDADGDTALHYAARFGSSRALNTLIKSLQEKATQLNPLKSMINVKNNRGIEPIREVESGLSVNRPNPPLIAYILLGWPELLRGLNQKETFTMLWDAGDNENECPIFGIGRRRGFRGTQDAEILHSCLAHDAFKLKHLRFNKKLPLARLHNFLEKRDADGFTALMEATLKGFLKDIQLLVFYGASLSQTAEDKKAPTPPNSFSLTQEWGGLLHLAARNKKDNPTVVTFFLEKGLDIESRNVAGGTPLHLAAAFGNKNCVRTLVEKGANVNAQDQEGDTPLHKVSDSLRRQENKYLAGHQSMDLEKHKKIQGKIQNLKEVIRFLISTGADLKIKNDKGEEPIDPLNPAWVLDFKKDVLPVCQPGSFPDGQLVLKAHPVFAQVYLKLLSKNKALLLVQEPNKQSVSPVYPPLSGGEIAAYDQLLEEKYHKNISKNLRSFFNNLANATKKKKFADVTIHFRWNPWV